MIHSSVTPKLTIVGAGPGDPELITLKGLRALQTANVVLYDALIDKRLLSHCPSNCLQIFVGKRRSGCMFSQDEINQMIVSYAFSNGHVVRLKGGDPFVFGRGWEELDFAQSFQIPVHVIPGVSSAIAVPALQHIPLTVRGVSESFWVTTGTTRHGTISEDIMWAAKSTATVVILMAMSKLETIMEIFADEGKSETAVAVIYKGSTPQEKLVLGKVSTIAQQVRKAAIDNPSVVIVGEVVALQPEFVKELSKRIQSPTRSFTTDNS